MLELPDPPPQPAPYKATTRIATIPSRVFRRFRRRNGSSKPAKARVEAVPHTRPFVSFFAVTGRVFTVTFTLAGFTPSSVAEAGLKVQLISSGRFPQES